MKLARAIVVSGLIGGVVGGLATAYSLDFFGDPRDNDAYLLSDSLGININGEVVRLPRGTTVEMDLNIDGQPYYSLHFYDAPYGRASVEKVPKWQYFQIER